MLLRLFANSVQLHTRYIPDCSPYHALYNEGFSGVFHSLWLIERRGIAVVEIVDTYSLPDETVKEAYLEAQYPAISKKLKIRYVFGTKRVSGSRFGKQVPALLVYSGSGKHPVDVYPRQQGIIVTIREFLGSLLNESEGSILERFLKPKGGQSNETE